MTEDSGQPLAYLTQTAPKKDDPRLPLTAVTLTLGGTDAADGQAEILPSKLAAEAAVAASLAQVKLSSTGADALGADFRVQLQLLECVAKQGRTLQRLSDGQEAVFLQLTALCRSAKEQSKAGRLVDTLFSEFKVQQDLLLTIQSELLSRPVPDPSTRPGIKKQTSTGAHSTPPPARPADAPKKTDPGSPDSAAEQHSPSVRKNGSDATASHTSEPGPLRLLLDNPKFDWFCGLVITMNAFCMGYTGEASIQWGITHVGEGEWQLSAWLKIAGYFFVGFYTVELLLKIFGYGREFFTNESKRWNVFDLILVCMAIYDLLTETFGLGKGMDVTWMRLLRLLKMLKMLRVVRLMRFFKELRTMIASMANAMSTLGWSIVMLFLMMYIFGLCFLQAVISFLADTPSDEIDPELLELIHTYWNSVPQACLSLFFAVSGGADWEPLGAPFVPCGIYYYFLFVFYICFSSIAVLNVLTGMFVDAAMKVAEDDESSVFEEIFKSKPVVDFIQKLEEVSKDSSVDRATYVDLLQGEGTAPLSSRFMDMAQINIEDAKLAFDKVSRSRNGAHQGKESAYVDEIVEGCIRIKEDMKGIDIVSMKGEIERIGELLTAFIENQIENQQNQ